MTFDDYFRDAAHKANIVLSDNQYQMFNRYYELLIDWNTKMNLTAITDCRDVAIKHMIDSLLCYRQDIFCSSCHVIDVGTGAGFPGIPLKIYQSSLKITLLDSLNKRLVYLQAVIEELGLKEIDKYHLRAEDAGKIPVFREQFDVAVSRAVARLSVLVELCTPFIKIGGFFVALKGAQCAEEIKEAKVAMSILGLEMHEVRQVVLPGIGDLRSIVYIKKTRATPLKYPRKSGIPEKLPIK